MNNLVLFPGSEIKLIKIVCVVKYIWMNMYILETCFNVYFCFGIVVLLTNVMGIQTKGNLFTVHYII